MARARNIKPGFFRNADLVELSFEARLLFVGLWTLADREGRLEDRPKQIKMEIFPADSIDCDALLALIAATGMLTRYEVDGRRYLQVTNFTKHQNPHRDERPSTIPNQGGNLTEYDAACVKHSASTVPAPSMHAAGTVAIVLIPDSLIPDSLIPDSSNSSELDSFGGAIPEAAAEAPEKKKRAIRLSEDWQLPKSYGDWTASEYPQWGIDKIRLEGEKFRDYWVPKSGKDAAKLDWLGTWRNWCRNAEDRRFKEVQRPGWTKSLVPASTAEYQASLQANQDEAMRMLGFSDAMNVEAFEVHA